MKKTHVVLLVCIAAAISALLVYMGDLTTYETIASAKQKQGKTVKVVATLDTSSIYQDIIKNPNYLTFEVKDTLGGKMKVAYYFEQPTDMKKSTRMVLSGKMENGVFEIKRKDGILLKCPSKYKDDSNAAKSNLNASLN